MDETVRQIRLPHIYTAFSVDAGLSVLGAASQAPLGDPLAGPSSIGTSGSVALGMIAPPATGGSVVGVSATAFIDALGVYPLILTAHELLSGNTSGLLALGFVLSAFSGAVVSMTLFLSDGLMLCSATTWLSGNLTKASSTLPLVVLAVMLLGFLLPFFVSRHLDVLMAGEDTATNMDVLVGTLYVQAVIGVALMTGTAVSLAGIIGLLGIMVPDVLPQVVGGSRHKSTALSARLDAVFLMTMDDAARWFTYPADLLVDIVIVLIGGPFFMYLLVKPLRDS